MAQPPVTPIAGAGAAVRPQLDADPGTRFELGGELGQRVSTTIDAWVIPAPRANPDMLEMFRRRERRPYQVVAPWAGEYAGKLTVAKVNTDEEQMYAGQLGIMAIPTMVIFKGGGEVQRIQGAAPKRILKERFDAALSS